MSSVGFDGVLRERQERYIQFKTGNRRGEPRDLLSSSGTSERLVIRGERGVLKRQDIGIDQVFTIDKGPVLV